MSNVAGKAYGMNVLTPMQPGLTWVQRLIYMTTRAFPATLSGLLGLGLIHFARWVIVRRDQWPAGDSGKPVLEHDYTLFCSNFNGTWDQYIDAFSDGIPQGLDLFWYASTKYPNSIPITPFKAYIVHNQFDTNYYYNATPGSAQRDIKAALKVYAELKLLDAKYRTLDPPSLATAYNRSLANIQNCLGSPGYAPIASLDTDRADTNRANFVAPPKAGAPAGAKSSPRAPVSTRPTNTFDGGHCFLTVLLPIKTCDAVDKDGMKSSPVHLVRDALAVLPTARQSPATAKLIAESPFTRSLRTHFARMAVIDDVIFNGREATSPLTDFTDRTLSKTRDQLPCPYLMFVADCDARNEAELDDYLREMWRTMGEDLKPVFTNCHGYDEAATSEDGFANYINRCRVETTMPFNDYWSDPPPPPSALLMGGLILLTVLGVSVAVFAGLHAGLHALHVISPWVALALVSGVAGVYAAYRLVMWRGAKPFPAAPNSDLKSILKALYVQRALIAFAIEYQGASPAVLHQALGAFLDAIQVNNISRPSQQPGIVP